MTSRSNHPDKQDRNPNAIATANASSGYYGIPIWDGNEWDNPCSTTSVQVDSTLSLTGTTANIVNDPSNKAIFATAIQVAMLAQNSGRAVAVINVFATDVSADSRRRRLLADSTSVSFTLVVPTADAAQSQSVFDAVVTDLAVAAGAGGTIENGDMSLLGSFEPSAFVEPTAYATVDGADSCTGSGIVMAQSGACECSDYFVGPLTWGPGGWSCTEVVCPVGSTGTVVGDTGYAEVPSSRSLLTVPSDRSLPPQPSRQHRPDGDSGCVVEPGYEGKAVALSEAPWLTSTIVAVAW